MDDGRHPVAAGVGCGFVVALLAAILVGLCWLGLFLLGPGGRTGWLILSTGAAFAVLVVSLLLIGYMLLSDTAPDPVPRRLYFAWLVVVLPVLGILAMASAWICFAVDAPGAARSLALGPWLAGLGVAASAGLVFSAVVVAE